MASLNYTSGNPNNLVAGNSASMADIQGPFVDIKTWANGGIDETNVPNLAAAFTGYRRLERLRTTLSGAPTSGVTYLLQLGTAAGNVAQGQASAFMQAHAFYFEPSIYQANARTTQLLLRCSLAVNATAPVVNYTVGMYSVATVGGSTTQEPFVATVSGTPITGSSIVFTNPSASSQPTSTASFTAPAAGFYVIGITPSATAAANAVVNVMAQLDLHQV